ncbi:MAG: DUF5657 family protein [Patescibacteria group bacterium]
MDFKDIIFKVVILLLAVFYYLYVLVISKQVKVMDKAVQDKYNWLILFVTSLQVTASLIILTIVLLSIFII